MSRLIHVYALKIGLFRDAGFKLTKRETLGLVDFCVFGVVVFAKSWFLCRLPTAAPANDLNLLKLLVQVESPSAKLKKLSEEAVWPAVVPQLSEELVALAFFDKDVDASEKRTMVEGLRHVGEEDPPKRTLVDLSTIPDKRLSSFVTSNTKNFFQVLAIPDSFLATDQDTSFSNSDYMVAEDIVRELRVVNDTAERGVALMQEFNALLTEDEEQTQFAIQSHQRASQALPRFQKRNAFERSWACWLT